MNAIETLYRNTGLVTEDGYVKVRDRLWIASRPYEKRSWYDADKSILPNKEELNEIYLKLQELIQIQESCGLESLRRILNSDFPWIWSSSTEYDASNAWIQSMSDGYQYTNPKYTDYWIVPIRRSL